MHRTFKIALIGGLFALVASFAGAAAAQTTVASSRAAHVSVAANSISSRVGNANTFTGQNASGEHASFIEFAVPASTTAFTSAELRLNAEAVYDGANDLTVYDFNSSIASDSIATIYTDVTGGTVLGTATGITTTGQMISIMLNADGLAAVNAARGSNVVFGFVASPLVGPLDGVFGGSNGGTTRELVLTPTATLGPLPVPTLSEWAMILLGTVLAGGAALIIQRRRFTV